MADYTGDHCETKTTTTPPPPTKPCQPSPCKGDCTCVPSCKHELGYYCKSRGGYIGKNCTIGKNIPTVNIPSQGFIYTLYIADAPAVTCDDQTIQVVNLSPKLLKQYDDATDSSYFAVSNTGSVKALSDACKGKG